ncbi:MAG: alpha/beta fold hydrolase [Geodermatophilaceae bacterium]|nr:alpha/beta fold hydrolase [Geodermatophilaceae bacterium]
MEVTTTYLELSDDGTAAPCPDPRVACPPERIPLVVVRPTEPGPFPAAILLHGGGQSGADWLEYATSLAARGVIVALPDAREHGRRLVVNPDPEGYLPVLEVLAQFLGGVADVRLVTDYLRAIEGCDGRVALQGFSLGGHIGLLAAGSDDRLDPVCLVGTSFAPTSADAGDYPSSKPDPATLARMVEATSVTGAYAELAQRRLLLVCGRDDPFVDAAVTSDAVAAVLQHGGDGMIDELVFAGEHEPPPWVQAAIAEWLLARLGS